MFKIREHLVFGGVKEQPKIKEEYAVGNGACISCIENSINEDLNNQMNRLQRLQQKKRYKPTRIQIKPKQT